MSNNYSLPPDPQNAVLKRIYPWDEYDITLVMQWLFAQANKTGFIGTFEDFKLRYGKLSDPQDMYDLIDNYTGTYHITPLVSIEQILQTKNKVLNENIIIDPVPSSVICHHKTYEGSYSVTPLPNVSQVLRTENKVLDDNIVIEEIPVHIVDNTSGGKTVTIG